MTAKEARGPSPPLNLPGTIHKQDLAVSGLIIGLALCHCDAKCTSCLITKCPIILEQQWSAKVFTSAAKHIPSKTRFLRSP